MTQDQFFAVLRKSRKLIKWKLGRHGLIRGRLGRKCFCPVTAVCYVAKGKTISTDYYHVAANLLNLPMGLGEDVAFAADQPPGVYLKPALAKLRRRLYRNLGLVGLT